MGAHRGCGTGTAGAGEVKTGMSEHKEAWGQRAWQGKAKDLLCKKSWAKMRWWKRSWGRRGKVQPELCCQHRQGQQKTPSADQTLPDCHGLAPTRTAMVAPLRLGGSPAPLPVPCPQEPAGQEHPGTLGFLAAADWAWPPATKMN